ncbi:dTMP kinase [Pacificibacter marinus]|uniref:Thymidylate kinase n=1 Tax=Pacificibacter marinus TaxID=658057 RepID=A0A1Y5SW16_9RHOB|nr:dTMP kinase [Pacificibacter marinus]SEK85477.1 thymidylate kinase [Pacificibacter marinus]SLN49725.1 Thymidylate kinase [Pacificibacter marinus]
MFISFEGIDGSGKSTQARLLATTLTDQGYDVVLTREPGGSKGAEEIRALVLEGDPDRWSPETELLLFTAARRDHLEKTIRPALAAGKIVICDRFADSTRVYQGSTRGDLLGRVNALHETMIGVEPDITVLVDIDPSVGLSRAKARQTTEERFEDFGVEMQIKMRAAFLDLAKSAERFKIINGAQSLDLVAKDIASVVLPHLDSPQQASA